MVYDALRTIMPIAGRDQRRRRSGAADPVSQRPRGGCSERAEQFPARDSTPPIIEPLSLDEAYLDVTENLKAISSATQIAEEIGASPQEAASPPMRMTASWSGSNDLPYTDPMQRAAKLW